MTKTVVTNSCFLGCLIVLLVLAAAFLGMQGGKQGLHTKRMLLLTSKACVQPEWKGLQTMEDKVCLHAAQPSCILLDISLALPNACALLCNVPLSLGPLRHGDLSGTIYKTGNDRHEDFHWKMLNLNSRLTAKAALAGMVDAAVPYSAILPLGVKYRCNLAKII